MLRQPILQLVTLLALVLAVVLDPLHAAKDPLPPLAADAGRILVYRDALMSPKAQPAVLIDGSETQPIKTRTYFQIDRTAGTYSLSLAGETAAPLGLTLTAGQTVYVCVNVHNSPAGTTELYPKLVDKTTALRELASCKYMPPENLFSATATPASPLRVLLTVKGRKSVDEKFLAIWDAWQKQGLLAYELCELPEGAAQLEPGATAKFDVLTMYDMVTEISPEQQKALVALLEKGIGVVSLHHNLGAHNTWPLWAEIVGGKFLDREETIGGKTYGKSAYKHDVWMKIGIPDPRHPIVRGVEPFYIFDETYGKTYRAPGIEVVLTTDRAGNEREVAWTKWFGNSPVFYFQLGHDSRAWSHPLFQKVLLQGVCWAASEAAKRRSTEATTSPR